MLTDLYIRNYTLIEELSLSFDQGLTVITGETGAGKSILLGAISLILGKRAETDVLMDKELKCLVEAHFDIKGYGFEDFFQLNDIEYAEQCILRREISPSGKSRAFINDTPASIQVMKDLGDMLVDIHSQHLTLTINQADVQLTLLDEFAGGRNQAAVVKQLFSNWKQLKQRKEELEAAMRNARKDNDYRSYLLSELEAAKIQDGELGFIENELSLIRNLEAVRTGLYQTYSVLLEGDINISSLASQAVHGLTQAGRYTNSLLELTQRLESSRIELEDIAFEVRNHLERIDENPLHAEKLEQRLDLIYNLMRKHDVKDELGLIHIKEELIRQQQSMDSREDELIKLIEVLDHADKELIAASKTLSQIRQSAIPSLEDTLKVLLHELGMPEARFKIQLNPLAYPGSQGAELAQFLFNANRGGEMNELSRVASGGERSRFMLALKSCITSRNLLPTIIFDEIDTGVSGEMASKVAALLQIMGERMQVIAITHLPQIAAKGSKHLLVQKDISGNKTITRVMPLSHDERIIEIAKMISGSKQSEASRKTAGELLSL